MNPLDTLLRAILAEPAEDAPRLAFADALDDHAGRTTERAEFIRLQCEIERLRDCREVNWGDGGVEWIRSLVRELGDDGPDHPALVEDLRLLREINSLQTREKELYDPLHTDWLSLSGFKSGHYGRDEETDGLCIGWASDTGKPPEFLGAVRRGFVSKLISTAEEWLRHADAIHWHPGATMECPECRGTKHRTKPLNQRYQCPVCKGQGRGTRPWPPSAHPVTKVTLVEPGPTWEQSCALQLEWQGSPECIISKRFPGVEFVLQVAPEPIGNYTMAMGQSNA